MEKERQLSKEEQVKLAYASIKLFASIGLSKEDAVVYHNCISILDGFVDFHASKPNESIDLENKLEKSK